MYGRNPFQDEDDEDSFASRAKKNKAITSSGGGPKLGNSSNPFEDEEESSFQNKKNNPAPVNSKQMLIQNSMNRQLESTTRCLASIYDSEAIGIATAEELIAQGEKLENVEKNVDNINEKTKEVQRHINSLKGVFGSIKNWWGGEGKKSTSTSASNGTTTRDRSNSALSKALSTASKDDHPTLKSKSCVKGFYDADVVEFNDYDDDGAGRSAPKGQVSSLKGATPTSKSSAWEEYEKGLENNLNLMSNGLENLKNLATGLNSEIVAQNESLDRINTKIDRSNAKIGNQNMQLNIIAGK